MIDVHLQRFPNPFIYRSGPDIAQPVSCVIT